MLALLGDSVTTDHISPAGSIKADTPAGQYLTEHGVEKQDFNSYGCRRGNHEVMIRGTFANIRLRNLLLDDVSGGYTRDFTADGAPQAFIYDAAQNYAAAGTPLVVLGGKEYGSGSSRDWAAKGTALLGVRAVIAESYERIHRSNLIGMGVLPLQFPDGETAASLGLDGTETFTISGVTALNDGADAAHRARERDEGSGRDRRVRRARAHRHPRRGRLLPQRRHHAVRAARDARARAFRSSSATGRALWPVADWLAERWRQCFVDIGAPIRDSPAVTRGSRAAQVGGQAVEQVAQAALEQPVQIEVVVLRDQPLERG